MRRLLLLTGVLVCLVVTPLPAFTQQAGHLCEQYTTRNEAQADFDADPDRFRELDDDDDGIACEHLPSTVGDDGVSLLPWIVGAVMLVTIGGGIWVMRRPKPGHDSVPDRPLAVAPDYDLGVEIDLAAIKAG